MRAWLKTRVVRIPAWAAVRLTASMPNPCSGVSLPAQAGFQRRERRLDGGQGLGHKLAGGDLRVFEARARQDARHGRAAQVHAALEDNAPQPGQAGGGGRLDEDPFASSKVA